MKKSITIRIFTVFIIFIIVLFSIIAILMATLLPSYYRNRKIENIQEATSYIRDNYEIVSNENLIALFDDLRLENGGDSYFLDESGQVNSSMGMKGIGNGQGKNRTISNQSTIEGPVYEAQTYNKIGDEIYNFGVEFEEGFILYEVSIESLDDAVGLMLEFLMYLVIISVLLAAIVVYILSLYITKPIKKLNELSQKMKDKEVMIINIQDNVDELGALENSLYSMYEELLSNIQRLETEMHKERAAESLKKQFLAQATHELKTPIAVIQGYSELVYDGIYKDEEERDHYIESIYHETESISNIITDVLDYSKMENGFFSINKRKVDILPWANKLISTYEDYIKLNNLEFNHDVSSEIFDYEMDSNRMEQVVKNLLSNAVEHGKTKVYLNIHRLEAGFVIEVENDGPFITEEDMPYLFESFYKKKGKTTGTGLGLAIVKQIVLLHGGDYRVMNTDIGVKFVILLR